MFIEINGKTMNATHIGDIKPDSKALKITYIFMGGRTEVETFETEQEFNAKLNSIKAM